MLRIAISVLFLSAISASAVSITDRYSSFWVLGDSLSDPGNLFALSGDTIPPSPPYFEGRFSNGPIWAEFVAKAFDDAGKPTGNFAFGGATAVADGDPVPDLDLQLGLLSASVGLFGPSPLVSLWFGGNDILGAADPTTSALAAVDAISNSITALASAGVTDFLIFDLPVFGPASITFNTALGEAISPFRDAGLSIVDINMNGIIQSIPLDPTSEITNFTDPCVITDSNFQVLSACTPAEARKRLLFDPVHPNAEVHARIANAVETQLAAVPIPGSIAALMLGLMAFGFIARKQT